MAESSLKGKKTLCVENGEINGYEQYLLFPQCVLKRLCCKHIKKKGLVWDRVKCVIFKCMMHLHAFNSFSTQSGLSKALRDRPFENIVGKEENAGTFQFGPV